MKLTILSLILASLAFGEGAKSCITNQVDVERRRAITSDAQSLPIYWASVATLMAAHVADVQSSWGRFEINPLLRSADGQFGAKGAAVKTGIVAGSLTIQAMIIRKWPKARKVSTVVNFIAAGVVGVVAARNYSRPKRY